MSGRIGHTRAIDLARAAVAALVVAAPFAALGGDLTSAWAGGGGTIACTGTSPSGPVSQTVTMDSATSGIAYLGSPSDAPGLGSPYISVCVLAGTIPSGWTIDNATDFSATDGSGNAGTLELSSDDHTISDSGTFTNSGTVDDVSPGFTQELDVADFVNTGTVTASQRTGASEGPDFEIAGPDSTSIFDNQGIVSAGAGATIATTYGTFVLDTGGTVAAAPGIFTLEYTSTLDVTGGSVTSGTITTTGILGHVPAAIEFGPSIPSTSTGAVQINTSIALSGTVPSGWNVAIDGGSVTAAPGAGNAGSITWDTDNSTISDTGTFTNSGSIDDTSTSNVQVLAATDFVNTGTVTSDAPGLDLGRGATTNVFDNQGSVTVSPGNTITVSDGTFELDDGGTVAVGSGTFQLADHSTFDVAGGSVTSGAVTTLVSLGVGPSNLTFAPALPSTSTGTIDVTASMTLNGAIGSGWDVEDQNGTLTAAPGSANDGTLRFNGGQTFTGTGAFTNSGAFVDAQFLDVSVAAFTNASGGSVSSSNGAQFTFDTPPANLAGGVLTGGTWSAAGRLNLNAPVTADDATITVSGSGELISHTVLGTRTDALVGLSTINSGASLALSGGANEALSSSLTNNGTITLGSSDELSLTGGITEGSGATLHVALAGSNPGQAYGRVVAGGVATLDGTLDVGVDPGYVATATDTQTVVTGSSVSGTFAALTGQLSTPNGDLDTEYLPNAVVLTVGPVVPPPVIAGVTFIHTPTNPEIVVIGSGFGSKPASVPACSAGNVDYAGNALWIDDTTTFMAAGEPGDCVGLKIASYTDTEIKLTFGSQYKKYPHLSNGDSFAMHVGPTERDGMVVYGAPTVLKVAAVSGPGAGGTKVHITGLGFTGATAVSFGGHAATSYTVNPAGTAIIAVAPAGHAGTVDVVVTTPIDTSVSWSADHFAYLAPSITAVKPASGSHAGGTKVHITGKALNGATAVMFGNTPATTYTVNTGGTSIAVTAPPGFTGVVDLTVTTPGGTSAIVSADHFTYS